MARSFPGMDPYLELSGDWRDLHARLITYCSDELADRLPPDYVARIDERFYLVEAAGPPAGSFLPDIAITREGTPTLAGPDRAGGVLTLEPETLPLMDVATEEARELWIEIRHVPDWDLVTAIELLSPTNKTGLGRSDYLSKRLELIGQPVNLVEIDVLLGGHRLPMKRPLPAGDYYALVSRAERRPDCQVYAWSVRHPLPTIPIPLRPPHADIPLALGELFATAYQRGRYGRRIDYSAPLDLPLDPEDRAWAEEVAQGVVRPA